MKGVVQFVIVERNIRTDRDRFDAGKRSNSIEELIMKPGDLFVRVVTRLSATKDPRPKCSGA